MRRRGWGVGSAGGGARAEASTCGPMSVDVRRYRADFERNADTKTTRKVYKIVVTIIQL